MIRHAPLLAATLMVAGLASSMEATLAQGMISRGRITEKTERMRETLGPREYEYGPERGTAIEELGRRLGLEPDVQLQGSGEALGLRHAPLSPPPITVQPRSLSPPLITNGNDLRGASSLRRGSGASGGAVSPQ